MTTTFSEILTGVKKLWTVSTGADADNAAVTKNPILIGGRYSTTPATRHDGDVTTLETDSTGRLLTVVSGSKTTLVKSVVANNSLITNVSLRIGNTVVNDTNLTCLDINSYPKRAISIYNAYNQAISLTYAAIRSTNDINSGGISIAANVSIAAGATLYIEPVSYPLINTTGIWLIIKFDQGVTPPTSGAVTVYVYGGGN